MRFRFLHAALLAGAVTGLAPACESEDPNDWSYDGTRSACSTGPAYELSTDFPQLTEEVERAPECVPRCGVEKRQLSHYGTTWTIAALPSGACAHDGEVCGMGAVRTRECPDGQTVACSLTPYGCRCEKGSWRCYAGAVGASACICTNIDGGR